MFSFNMLAHFLFGIKVQFNHCGFIILLKIFWVWRNKCSETFRPYMRIWYVHSLLQVFSVKIDCHHHIGHSGGAVRKTLKVEGAFNNVGLRKGPVYENRMAVEEIQRINRKYVNHVKGHSVFLSSSEALRHPTWVCCSTYSNVTLFLAAAHIHTNLFLMAQVFLFYLVDW